MRVLLSGYYGYGNIGDEALLAGLIAGLRERGLEPVVLSADPDATRRAHGVAAAHRYHGLPRALLGSAALVSGGGGLLQDATSTRSLRYYLGVIRLARGLGKRVVVYGQSLGPLSAEGRQRVAHTLRGVPTAVRDLPSAALAQELGLRAEHVADPALLLALPPAPAPLGADRRPVLLIPRFGHDNLNAALGAAARILAAEQVPLAILALHPAEDAPAARHLQATAGGTLLPATTPQDALRHVLAARYVLSVRLHGLILASRAGVGFAGLVYDPKVEGFAREAGAPALRAPIDVARLAALARDAQPPDAAPQSALRARATAGLDWLGATLRATGA